MSDALNRLLQLSPEQQRQLLEQLLRERRGRQRSVPLSDAQRSIWFLEQLEPGQSLYNMSKAFRLHGPLATDALQLAIMEIVRRHDALRTTFRATDGEPVQVVAPSLNVPLRIEDLTDCPAHQRQSRALALAQQEIRRPFDLAEGPLLRVTLLRLSDEEHVLVLVMHHIIGDGWSMGVFFREARLLYDALKHGRTASLPELTVQYADYALWERERLKGEAFERQLSYWTKRLAGIPAMLDLPTDHPRPAVETHAGAALSFRWDRALSAGIKALCRQKGVTLHMLLMAAFQVLLHRYTGERTIVLGSPVANRNRSEVEALIGCFVNTLVLRTDVDDNVPFEELLAQVKENCLGAYAHQNVPFDRLVQAVAPDRHLHHNPLFQVMFIVQNASEESLELTGLSVNEWELETGVAKFDLTLSVSEVGDHVAGFLEYNTDLFRPETAERMLRHYQVLIEGILADPTRLVSRLPLLLGSERHQLLVEWDNTSVTDPVDVPVHKLFEAQAEARPAATAVRFKGEAVSYRELNEQSNRLARALSSLGAAAGAPVAILLENGPRQVDAALGVMKCGGVFLFLDRQWPTERCRQILTEVRPVCLLTEGATLAGRRELVEWMEGQFGTRTVLMDSDGPDAGGRVGGESLNALPAHNPATTLEPAAPVYLAYTSGSTGTPKGILQNHRGLSQVVQWHGRLINADPSKRIAQWASFAYDAAYVEVFLALCHGATLCLPADEQRHDPPALIPWLEQERISALTTVPSFARQILDLLDSEWEHAADPLPDLEHLMLSGEAIPVALARRWLQRFRHRPKLYNLYGPSECVLATCCAVDHVAEDERSVPVGRPFDGRQILILDQAEQLCPIGVRGEIYIRSPYLSSGYFGRPEQTAAAFIRNPLNPADTCRLYRTGDQGRWRTDGNIELFGRTDHQVKLRGMRVELGEIEAVLATGPGVRECAVTALDRGDGDLQLVAYVVAEDGGLAGAWRAHLKERLPEYMVPAAYVLMTGLPRTVSAKLDRRRLPAPSAQDFVTEEEFVGARDEDERVITAIWCDVLGLDRIGVHDNFFVLGGHSLLATQVVNRIRKELSVEIPLRRLFETPTVAAVAGWMGRQREQVDDQNAFARMIEQVDQLSEQQALTLLQGGREPPGPSEDGGMDRKN